MPNSRALRGPRISRACSPWCCKLLQIVRPDRVFFGEKDYQQLVLVRQMVADLNVDVQVVGVPIVRETDGLAMSSRNRYLDAAQRELAGALSAALLAGTYAAAARCGRRAGRGPRGARRGARDRRRLPGGARHRAGPAPADGAGRLLVAARLGSTRLLDNIAIDIGATVGVDGRVPAPVAAGLNPRITLEELMLRTMLKSKIHRATVTQADLHYVGLGDDRRRPDGRGRSARGRAGDHRRHRQRRAAGHLRDHRPARQRCDRNQRRRSASRASR